MGALVASSVVYDRWGQKQVVMATMTIGADGDTWKPGLGTIDQVVITPTTATAGQFVSCSHSGGTITFAVEGGTPVLRVTAVGV